MSSEKIEDIKTKLIRLLLIFKVALLPRKPMRVNEWAEKYRYLSTEDSSEPGLWRTERFPWTEEIMMCLSYDSPYEDVSWISGTQVAKTAVGLNFIGYTAHWDPGPFMYAERSLEKLKRFNRGRLEPMIRASAVLSQIFHIDKSHNRANSQQMKEFPGGILYMAGSNSAGSLRGNPVMRIHGDEIDNWLVDVNKEGDPVALIEKRCANFPNRKKFWTSSPTNEETSRIKRKFLEGDQRYYKVPCPECRHMQMITWQHLVGVDAEGIEVGMKADGFVAVKMKCENCKTLIDESKKTWMCAKVNGAKWEATFPGRTAASFHLSALYSPVPFYTWKKAADEFVEYSQPGREADLKVWINTVLAETWSIAGQELDARVFDKRREPYPEGCDVPNEVMLLTCAFDIQGDRAEGEVIGWGRNQESWGIDYVRIMGDPEKDDLWKDIDDYLLKFWKKENGQYMQIAGAGIDAGYKHRRAVMFCATRKYRKIFPILGRTGWGKGLINRPTKTNKDGVWVYQAYVDELKSRVHAQLKIQEKGPGFCHFPKKPCYDAGYFKMLAAERLVNKRGGGIKWEKVNAGARNEALDVRAYNIAILNAISPAFDKIGSQKAQGIVPRRRRIVSRGIE